MRFLKNAGWMTSGNFLAALLGLANMALTARILGLSDFGIFVLITTYAAIIERLASFQTWQGLIRYGTSKLTENKPDQFCQLVKFSTILDIGGAIGGAAIGFILAPLVGQWMNMSTNETHLMALFSLILVTRISGMPTAVLRIHNRYHALSFQNVLSSLITLIGLAYVWAIHGGELIYVLCVYAISQTVGNIYLLGNGLKALRDFKFHDVWKTPLTHILDNNPGFLKFVIVTSVESCIKIIRQLDVFIIKYLLTAEAVAIYRVARRLADTLTLAIDPFFQAIYPELSRLHAEKKQAEFEKLMKRSSLFIGGGVFIIFLGFLALGPLFIHIVFGPAFADAYPIASICILSMVIWAVAQPLSPALYTFGALSWIFNIHLSTAILYVVMLYFMLIQWGVLGAAIALLIFFMLWSGSMAIAFGKNRAKSWI